MRFTRAPERECTHIGIQQHRLMISPLSLARSGAAFPSPAASPAPPGGTMGAPNRGHRQFNKNFRALSLHRSGNANIRFVRNIQSMPSLRRLPCGQIKRLNQHRANQTSRKQEKTPIESERARRRKSEIRNDFLTPARSTPPVRGEKGLFLSFGSDLALSLGSFVPLSKRTE